MRVLITGAFGRLGTEVVKQALAMGHEPRCLDMDTPASRKAARAFDGQCDTRFADLLRTGNFSELLDGIDAVIHLAAMLPPATEQNPELAERLNVDVCTRLIDAIAASGRPIHLVYPSTLSVFAETDDRQRPRRLDDPVQATDNYTAHKLAVEQRLQAADFPWTILRVGVSVDSRTLSADRGMFRKLLAADAATPVEWVHPQDVALAMCRCLEVPESRGRTLLIGGGPRCQVSHARFMGAAFRAMGLRYPVQVHGSEYFYMHWLETAEAQALLQFQQHEFSDYEREMAQRLRRVRVCLLPFRWLVNPLLAPLLRAA